MGSGRHVNPSSGGVGESTRSRMGDDWETTVSQVQGPGAADSRRLGLKYRPGSGQDAETDPSRPTALPEGRRYMSHERMHSVCGSL